MTQYTSVLFDLDGTLLQTADDLGAALNHVLKLHKLSTISPEQYTPEASNGSRGLLQLGFGSQLKNYDFEQLKAQLLNYYAQNIAIKTDYFPQVAETLKVLNQNNIPWGIVTNKPQNLTTPLLTHFDLLNHCAVAVSGDTVGVAKPNPEPMNYALNKLGVKAEDCLYVGDAQRDIEAGKNVNMPTVAALYGYIAIDDDPQTWGADYQINEFQEILKLLTC